MSDRPFHSSLAHSSLAHPLLPVGWSSRVEALCTPALERGLVPARVVGVERGWCRLATLTGERSFPRPGLAVGDWVAMDGDTVREVLPRWSALARLDPDGGRQVLAANLDVVLIAAPGDRLSSARVERELVMAWDSGARPVVVLTKLDRSPAQAAANVERRPAWIRSTGLPSAAVTGDGLDEVPRSRSACPVTAVLLWPVRGRQIHARQYPARRGPLSSRPLRATRC